MLCSRGLLLLFLLLPVGISSLSAATLAVDPVVEIGSDGQCSLIEALVNSEADAAIHGDCASGSGTDRLILSPDFEYALSQPWQGGQNGLPRLTTDLEIVGRGATIGRRTGSPAFRLFEIDGGNVILGDLNLLNGRSSGNAMVGGGALWIHGDATVSIIDTRIEGNHSEGLFTFGGAIRMDDSDLAIVDCRLDDNTAISTSADAGGGAIAQFGGTLTIQRSALLDNRADFPPDPMNPDSFLATGGALRIEAGVDGAIARIEDSTLAGNIGRNGGAIHVVAIANTGTVPADILVELLRSTVVLNDAAGGLGDGIRVQEANGGDGIVLYGSSILIGNGIEVAGQIVGSDCSSNAPSQDFLPSDGNVLKSGGDCTTFGFDALIAAADQVLNLVRNQDHYLPLAGGPAVNFSEANLNCPPGSVDQLGKLRADGPGAGDADCDAGAIELYQPVDTNVLSLSLNGNGSGQVTSLPAGIDCPGTCSAAFPATEKVQLVADADPDSEFAGWSGDCSGSTICVVGMTQDRSVGATFARLPVTLNVLIDTVGGASGSVSSQPSGIQCPGDCSGSFAFGSAVQLIAASGPGSEFIGWAGACAAQSGPICNLDMNGNRTATARFQPVVTNFPLSVRVEGQGSVGDNLGGIACPGDCSEAYAAGTEVELTANSATGFSFQNFSGACSGQNCSLTMDAPRTVTAVFVDADALFVDQFE